MPNILTTAFNFKEIFSSISSHWYLYVIFAVLLVVVGALVFTYKGEPKNTLTKTQKICHVALFTALSAISNLVTFFPASSLSLSLVMAVCFIGGYLYGVKAGFVIGFVGDLIAGIVAPMGAYNPIIGLSTGLFGVISAIAGDKKQGSIYIKIIIATLVSLLICSAGLNTFGLYVFYGIGKKTYLTYLIGRLPVQIIVAFINAVVTCAVIRLFYVILPKNKFKL